MIRLVAVLLVCFACFPQDLSEAEKKALGQALGEPVVKQIVGRLARAIRHIVAAGGRTRARVGVCGVCGP